VGQILNDALPAFARRLRMWQILEPGIPVLEVLITNRPNKIADVVENPVRVLRVTAPNSRFDEAPPVSNTSNNHYEILAHCIEGGPTHWRSLPYTNHVDLTPWRTVRPS
jgi:hypothetical protein